MDIQEQKTEVKRHPWELARWQLVQRKLETLLNKVPHPVIADIGAGDLFVSAQIKKTFSHRFRILAVDVHFSEEGVRNGIEMFQSIDQLTDQSVDLVLLLDILEHIKDDQGFILKVFQKLKPDGYALISVPAMQSLYSNHDRRLGHFRRYSKKQLQATLNHKNIVVQEIHYLFSCLVIPRMMQKIFSNKKLQTTAEIADWPFQETHGLTKIIRQALVWDAVGNFILSRFKIPSFGLSLGVICQKQASSSSPCSTKKNASKKLF